MARLVPLMTLATVAIGFAAFASVCRGGEGAPAVEYCEKVVCVPEWVDEVRTCYETHYRKEIKQRDVTTYKQVQVPKTLECKHTIFVNVKKPDVQKLDIAKPVQKWVEEKYTVMVPHEELHKGTRKVCRPVAGCCCGKYELVEEPYECMVTVCVPQERTCKKCVWETQHTEKVITREICTVEAKVISKPYTVTECVWQPVVTKQNYEACVPYTVEKKVTVKVCKMVQKTVRVPKCACACCD
jgi:hypothetical protein